jgi:iron-sulfur cluster assembly accessory protein
MVVLCASFVRAADAPATAPTTAPAPAATPITVAARAAAEIKQIINQQQLDVAKVYLRVGVTGGGDEGFRYLLDLSEEAGAADDAAFESAGVRVRVDPRSELYLRGTTIDFKDEDGQKGFVFRNPNAVPRSPAKE